MESERRVALVTGGSRGIGRAIAERLAAAGSAVVVNYHLNGDAATETVEAISRAGGVAVAMRGDVTDQAQACALFESAEQRFGRLDTVVSNAGVARFAPIAATTDDDFEETFALNTRATFFLLREAANRLRDNGRVVVISSGVTLTHRTGTGVYGASKAAVEHLVRVLAKELGPRQITVNSVLPGGTRTDALLANTPAAMLERIASEVPLGRLGTPDDIAEIVAFLASPGGRWVTGQSIAASGGAF
ncbi:3-oxoacyl-[acyl-carrier protein] reductase [Parafrankia irregularis]|uniref:3-oxoacyl-[acyl-carrier protein] reductase n=1 Tax=Parafrankia irregularis TaxID=795642 RepID=A0A0S4QSL4_9ACTN|nr:SDR family oxidoreductase [Parafrankia sp. CH37]MBE3205940.1 SDR family oxidoreductase [Parafrankia sp. CH37]CUU58111.1 3-oxoacyl-[acyl-carrier protein] reductase [Parafrankia irregularis]